MEKDTGIGMAKVGVGVQVKSKDSFMRKTEWNIKQFDDPTGEIEKASKEGMPMEQIMEMFGAPTNEISVEGNVMLNEGINELWKLVSTSGATQFDNTNAYIGVGDDATAEDAAQTDLIGTSKKYVAMDSGYPTAGTSQKTTWRSTFGVNDANWHWQEVTVANGGSGASKNLNRKVQDLGTKASGTTWICSLEITLS